MAMMKRPRIGLAGTLGAAAFALAACATQPTWWHKEGTSPAEYDAARTACLAYAEKNFNEFTDYGSPVGPSPVSEREMEKRLERESLFGRCMEGRGYRLVTARNGNVPANAFLGPGF